MVATLLTRRAKPQKGVSLGSNETVQNVDFISAQILIVFLPQLELKDMHSGAVWLMTALPASRTQPWRRRWRPTPALLPGKSHGPRSLAGCSPWGREESDTTERLHFDFSLSCIGEGNGNPLQCSCLENPRDGEAWWAAVYGVAQSRTRLK